MCKCAVVDRKQHRLRPCKRRAIAGQDVCRQHVARCLVPWQNVSPTSRQSNERKLRRCQEQLAKTGEQLRVHRQRVQNNGSDNKPTSSFGLVEMYGADSPPSAYRRPSGAASTREAVHATVSRSSSLRSPKVPTRQRFRSRSANALGRAGSSRSDSALEHCLLHGNTLC